EEGPARPGRRPRCRHGEEEAGRLPRRAGPLGRGHRHRREGL
ncbi:MAG: hypothetical protein AVDCRST_MAG06-580, partial [uncultured Nocardioides sp.]